jgi:hypothetical protein
MHLLEGHAPGRDELLPEGSPTNNAVVTGHERLEQGPLPLAFEVGPAAILLDPCGSHQGHPEPTAEGRERASRRDLASGLLSPGLGQQALHLLSTHPPGPIHDEF